jgi:putative ABC transport system permease protein
MGSVFSDIRYALRALSRNPGLVSVALLSLALGTGANTAIFTLVKAVFLRPMVLGDVDRLVMVWTTDSQINEPLPVSHPNFRDYREHQTVFSGMATAHPASLAVFRDQGAAQRLRGEIVSSNYFDVLAVKASLGRTFSEAADMEDGGNARVAVLSHGAWERAFGADPGIINRSITLNRQTVAVIGVMPSGFQGISPQGEPDVWLPMSMARSVMERPEALTERKALYFAVVARLAPGASIEQAQSSLQPIAQRLAADFPDSNYGRGIRLQPIREAAMNVSAQRTLAQTTTILMVVVGLILMIACANVAALLLVRARSRSKEIAVRLAIGASGWQISRQVLTESVLLSLGGACLGLLVARWTRDVLWSLRPPWLTSTHMSLALDVRVLGFTLGIAIATGVLFGLAPALQNWSTDLARELKERNTQRTEERGFWTLRGWLVIAQCALSVIALAGSVLFVQSLQRLRDIDAGFETGRLLATRLSLPSAGLDRSASKAFHRAVVERVQGLPQVESAAVSTSHPFALSGFLRAGKVEGQESSRTGVTALTNGVSPGYFETVGMRLVEGRFISRTDTETTPAVLVVNQSFARRVWPNQSAVGKGFRFTGDPAPRRIVGVVADSKFVSLTERPIPCIYIPLEQDFQPIVTLLVRSTNPAAILSAVTAEVQAMDRHLPVPPAVTLDDMVTRSLWAPRLIATLVAMFAGVGLLLAATGVYGLSAYAVTQRKAEIGLRMAMGATPRQVLRLIVGQAMALVGPGILIGMVLAVGLSRLAGSLIYGISVLHPPAYLAAAALLATVALLATLGPAVRAIRIDPLVALRQE